MARETKVLTVRMGDVASGNTLERHLEYRELPKLLAEGWIMVSASPLDAQGISTITLEREIPDDSPKQG